MLVVMPSPPRAIRQLILYEMIFKLCFFGKIDGLAGELERHYNQPRTTETNKLLEPMPSPSPSVDLLS
jgi:hypothetical protein